MDIDRCKTAEQTQETLEILAPFMSSAVLNELCSGRQYVEYRERKLDDLRAQMQRSIWIQRNIIARQLAMSTPRRVDGFRWLGTIEDKIHFEATQKYGRKCWKDPDFLKHTFKHTPEARAPQAPAPFVVVNGFRDERKQSARPDRGDYPAGNDRNAGAANGDPAVAGQLPGKSWPGEPATAVC